MKFVIVGIEKGVIGNGGTPLTLENLFRVDHEILEETDPTVPQHVKNIQQSDIDNWNNPPDPGTTYSVFDANTNGLVPAPGASSSGYSISVTSPTEGQQFTEGDDIVIQSEIISSSGRKFLSENGDWVDPLKNVLTATEPTHAINKQQAEEIAAEGRTEKLIPNTTQYTILAEDVDKILKFTANAGEEIQLIYNENTLPDVNKSIVAMSTGDNYLIPTVGTEAVAGTVILEPTKGSLLRTTGKKSLITIHPGTSVNDLAVWGNLEAEAVSETFTEIAENEFGTHPAFTTQHNLNAYLLGNSSGGEATTLNSPEPISATSAGGDSIDINWTDTNS